jgi:hypothetical protein
MDNCRIARRIALLSWQQDACGGAGTLGALATKDMHSSVQSLSPSTRAGAAELTLLAGLGWWGSGGAGVWLSPCRGGARRVGWPFRAAAPLNLPLSLATKEKTVKETA